MLEASIYLPCHMLASYTGECELVRNGSSLFPSLQSTEWLSSSFLCFGSILAPWNGVGAVLESCLETILRLGNHHLKNLSEVCKILMFILNFS